jgi:hypothetical protein
LLICEYRSIWAVLCVCVYIYNQSYIWAVLGSEQNWVESVEISTIHPTLTIHALPHQCGAFVTIYEPTLIYNDYPKPRVYLRVILSVRQSVGLENVFIVAHIHH